MEEKNRAPPVQAVPDEKTEVQKQSLDEEVKQSLRKLRWMLGNAVINANKGVMNKH